MTARTRERTAMTTAVTYEDVEDAARRLHDMAHRTSIVTSRRIDTASGHHVFLKCENVQRTGSFKFRGAFNALSRFDAGQRRAGVATYSSGNHAQAVALSARLLDIPATIVMPSDAPAVKVEATRSYGATVITYDRYTEDREDIGRRLSNQYDMTLIPPYDHPDVIAGQGTATKELIEQVGKLDVLLVPLGGGGLLSGACLAARALSPECRVYGVEPAAGDDARQSLRSGHIMHIDTPQTIADGAQTQHVGQHTFPIIQREIADIHTVTDDELVTSMRTLASTTKMIVEPTGCLGFAALHEVTGADRRVGVVISGGNVDLNRYASILSTPPRAVSS
jgi:threo-3-hydroxy-L-aspartate ammonia-lyase